MKDNLSYLLSTIDFIADIESGKKKMVDCEFEILKQQPKWQKYLEQQADLLKEAIKVFKNYDKIGNLKYFWQDLKNQKIQFTEGIFKQLVEYAVLAYERGNLHDAYKMFSFIATYYPSNYNAYLYLGEIVQALYGAEEASTFFKTMTSIFLEADLLFLAAENEFQRENIVGARDYLERAKQALSEYDDLTEYEEELKSRIEELLNALNS